MILTGQFVIYQKVRFLVSECKKMHCSPSYSHIYPWHVLRFCMPIVFCTTLNSGPFPSCLWHLVLTKTKVLAHTFVIQSLSNELINNYHLFLTHRVGSSLFPPSNICFYFLHGLSSIFHHGCVQMLYVHNLTFFC